jgi:hypothetical protein
LAGRVEGLVDEVDGELDGDDATTPEGTGPRSVFAPPPPEKNRK